MLDLERLQATPVADVPFPFLIVPNFIRRSARASLIAADFPQVTKAGSFHSRASTTVPPSRR